MTLSFLGQKEKMLVLFWLAILYFYFQIHQLTFQMMVSQSMISLSQHDFFLIGWGITVISKIILCSPFLYILCLKSSNMCLKSQNFFLGASPPGPTKSEIWFTDSVSILLSQTINKISTVDCSKKSTTPYRQILRSESGGGGSYFASTVKFVLLICQLSFLWRLVEALKWKIYYFIRFSAQTSTLGAFFIYRGCEIACPPYSDLRICRYGVVLFFER